MNKIFYTKENLEYLKKKRKLFLCFSLLFILVFAGLFTLFMLLATRENKSLIKVIGIISVVIAAFAFIFSFTLFLDFKRKYLQFVQIYDDKGEVVEGIYLSRTTSSISLQDKSSVYEILFKTENGEKKYFLVSLFDFEFVENKKYKITLVSGFIKGVEYEE